MEVAGGGGGLGLENRVGEGAEHPSQIALCGLGIVLLKQNLTGDISLSKMFVTRQLQSAI